MTETLMLPVTFRMRRYITPTPMLALKSDPTHTRQVCGVVCRSARGRWQQCQPDDKWTTVQPDRVPFPSGTRSVTGGVIDYDRELTGALPGYSESETRLLLSWLMMPGCLEGNPEAAKFALRHVDVDSETYALLSASPFVGR